MFSRPPSSVDVAIVGAGAAGLAAARRLGDAPLSVVVLEARDRIGGRAHTRNLQSHPQDLGCGWLHSADRNAWARRVEPMGFTLDKTPPPWGRQSGDQDFAADDQESFNAAQGELDRRVEEAAAQPGDAAVSTLMTPGGRWNALLNAISAFYNGAEFEQVSIKDYAAFCDTEINWRVLEGYGALISTYGADAPVVLNCAVDSIDRSGPDLTVATNLGEITAGKVIVAVPSAILAEERLKITPALPEMLEAAAGLPLGLADKLVLACDEPELFPKDGQLLGRTDSRETGAYHLRPFGRPLIEGFFGGDFAHVLEAEGDLGMAAFGIDQLVALVGSGLRRKLHLLAATAWAADPFARGSYSYAMPGCHAARAALTRPVEDRLFFAGEHCSPTAFSTAHGAFETGVAAADAVLRACNLPLPADPLAEIERD